MYSEENDFIRAKHEAGLNPCYSGKWTLSKADALLHVQNAVLILVILEDEL